MSSFFNNQLSFPLTPSVFTGGDFPYDSSPTDGTDPTAKNLNYLLAEQDKNALLYKSAIRDLRGNSITERDLLAGNYTDQFNGLTGPTDPTSAEPYRVTDDQSLYSFSGGDMRVLLELDANSDPQGPRSKQLIELSTISVSVHREKALVRAVSYINPKGIARGTRTIAGTMILTQFNVDILYRFIEYPSPHDLSHDSFYQKPDQIPPFNLILLFADELGNSSMRRLIGVEMVTDGTTYSINDMYTEQTISYYAMDFTPLIPFDRSALHRAKNVTDLTSPKRTVRTVRSKTVNV